MAEDTSKDGGSIESILNETLLNRRHFLRNTAVVGGALAFGPLGLGACGSGTSTSASSTTSSAAANGPTKGGNLRIGVSGGSARDVLDLHLAYTTPDALRGIQLFDCLAGHDHDFKIINQLAEEITPTDASARVWIVRVKPGIVFHNGKTLSADDVIYSFKRILNPDYPNGVSMILADVDPSLLKKLDERTVEVHLKRPNAILDDLLSQYKVAIVPVGYDLKKPIGTGPFKYQTFTPGERSVFLANTDYWGEGPYVDQVETIDFADDVAKVNALQTGAVDVIAGVPSAQVEVFKNNPDFKTVLSETGQWVSYFCRVDLAPWTDVRVRQAMRLIPDRPKTIELALGGLGRLGNDMYSPLDPAYPADFPQRVQDLEQAKSLLKQAGQEGLRVECNCAPLTDGAVESAQVLAQMAKGAGVNVTVKKYDVGTYYGENLFKWPFGVDYYFTRNFLSQDRINRAWNQCHWDDEEYNKIVNEAFGTVDSDKRNALVREAYKILYDRGGWCNWSFTNTVDVGSKKVEGIVPDKYGIPINCGHVNQLWLSA